LLAHVIFVFSARNNVILVTRRFRPFTYILRYYTHIKKKHVFLWCLSKKIFFYSI